MKVFKIFVDLDKEEAYLRKMAQNGYILVKYSIWGVYSFREAAPQELNYQVDYRAFKNKQQFEQYVTLFDDAGWTLVSGGTNAGSQYFLPKTGVQQTNSIFSDKASKAAIYKQLAMMCLVFALASVASFGCSLVIYLTANHDFSPTDYHSWYFTPGLWEKTGLSFWNAFWFETPFVILRVFWPVIVLALALIYGIWTFKAWRLYKHKYCQDKE